MKNFSQIEVFGSSVFLFLFLLVHFHCYSITNTEANLAFKKDWKTFLKSKEFDNCQPVSEEYEFFLLDEFTEQQYVRCRPFIETMDRHSDYRPFKENRVVLSNGTEMSASFVYTSEQNQYQDFIASQAPLKQSVHHFWQMVLEQKIEQIVMLTEFLYHDDQEELADLYWPTSVHETIVFENDISVTLLEEKNLLDHLEEYIQVRRFQIKSKNEERIVTHYWYRHWLDNEVPRHIQAILSIINRVERDKNDSGTISPILVHCSAGVGRTGVFIALYHFLEREKYHDAKINLFEFIAFLRWQRPYMVGVLPQYTYCNQVYKLIQDKFISE